MSQPRPRVRSACEACHKRKQRCIIPDAGGACQACQQHSRQCYFFPRFRPGRPQRKQADSAAYASASTNGASSSPTPISPPTGLDLRLGQAADQLEMVPTEPEVLSQNSSNAEPQSMDLDVFQESLGRMWETVSTFPSALTSADVVELFDAPMLTESSDEDVPGAPIANMTPQPGPSVRLDSTSSSLAQCFISLDNHNEMLLASYRNANHDEDFQKIVDPVMATVADTCPMAVDLLTGATSGIADQSVGPIITAIMIKVFDMCELVVTLASRKAASFVGSPRAFDQTVRPALPRRTSSSQWSRETNAQSMVKFVLTLKQVDIHLTQAKLCLSLLGHEKATHPDYAELTPAERSDGLHERISSIIDEICD